jgi:NADP-dependent 3-hydroxy acid dehydrogenase YdfG
MKVSITGHTSGIGLALANTFKEHSHDVIGFSKNLGHDIGEESVRKIIVEQSNDCDIFINNAFHLTGQEQLLNDMLQSWESKSKFIINISSMITQYCDGPMFQGDIKLYKDSKTSTNNTITNYKGSVQILNVLPGLVDTPFFLMNSGDGLSGLAKFKGRMIDPVYLSDIIYNIAKYKDNLVIKELKIDNLNNVL